MEIGLRELPDGQALNQPRIDGVAVSLTGGVTEGLRADSRQVLAHRILLDSHSEYTGVSPTQVVEKVLAQVPVPAVAVQAASTAVNWPGYSPCC